MKWGEIGQKEDAGDEKPSAARDDIGGMFMKLVRWTALKSVSAR